MRALIFAAGLAPDMAPLTSRRPNVMLPLMDRSFIQHMIESLVGRDVTDFDIVLSHLPEQVERLLRQGNRWGCSIRYHLAKDPDRPYRRLAAIWPGESDETVLIGHADRLPDLDLGQEELSGDTPLALVEKGSGDQVWTGWATMTAADLAGLDVEGDFNALGASVLELVKENGRLSQTAATLSATTYTEILAAHQRVLAREYKGLMFSAMEAEAGVWLSRNVSLHPTARIVPPVFIGENCRIDVGVQIGPNAVIGADCSLDQRCSVSDSVVLPGSYVGRGLELTGCLVDRNRLINVALGVDISMSDDFLLGSLTESTFKRQARLWISRLAGTIGLAAGLPLLLLVLLGRLVSGSRPFIVSRPFVKLPSPRDPVKWKSTFLTGLSASDSPVAVNSSGPLWAWRHLALVLLPGLIDVIRGRVGLVGLPPRSADEIKALDDDWRNIYLKGRVGLVTEALVQFGTEADDDELYSAEAYYAATASFKRDVSLFMSYLGRLLPRRGR